MSRNCIVKKLYAAATPYVQLVGWVTLAVPVIYSASTWVSNTTAYGDDIKDLKSFKQSTGETLAAVKQEVHDIHEWIKEDRR